MSKTRANTKVGFVSLGCPKNLVDSEVMMGILSREGYELTPHAAEAEILVVNTCSFIESAQKESVDTILEMAEHKKFGAAKKLIVAGCLVERFREQILEQVPEVDAVIGTGEIERILEAVEGELRMLPAQPPAFLYHDLTPRIVTTPKHAAYIKIAKAAIIRVRSASFLSYGGRFAAGDSSRWSARRRIWRGSARGKSR